MSHAQSPPPVSKLIRQSPWPLHRAGHSVAHVGPPKPRRTQLQPPVVWLLHNPPFSQPHDWRHCSWSLVLKVSGGVKNWSLHLQRPLSGWHTPLPLHVVASSQKRQQPPVGPR